MTPYKIEVSIMPLCTSCGSELRAGPTQSRPKPLDRDNPYERTDRRVYVEACTKCFVHKSDIPGTPEHEEKLAR